MRNPDDRPVSTDQIKADIERTTGVKFITGKDWMSHGEINAKIVGECIAAMRRGEQSNSRFVERIRANHEDLQAALTEAHSKLFEAQQGLHKAEQQNKALKAKLALEKAANEREIGDEDTKYLVREVVSVL